MLYSDFLIVVVACFQPIVIGFIVIIGASRLSLSLTLFKKHGSYRYKATSTRLYECSTNYRLAHFIVFELNAIGLLLMYLVYDVDFLFFLAEMTTLQYYSVFNLIMFSYFIFLFILGLLLDVQLFGVK